jgi:DNA ligase-1
MLVVTFRGSQFEGYELIPTWEVQQAYPIDAHPIKVNAWFSLSQKLNGNHGSYHNGKLISRQGKDFTGLQHIIEDIESVLDNPKSFFIDGELIRKNVDNVSDGENFQIGTGIINSNIPEKLEIEFIIYEIFPVEEFDDGISKLTYKQRLSQYLIPFEQSLKAKNIQNVKVVQRFYEGTDQTKIKEFLDYADSVDYEGLMANLDTKYDCKRNAGILKVKSFKHSDLLCKRIELGDGKNADVLGAIIVDYKGFECGVGSGFTDKQRKYYIDHQDEIVGKIVQVKFKAETKNKQGGLSMQFPIFEIVRTDKTEPSYN